MSDAPTRPTCSACGEQLATNPHCIECLFAFEMESDEAGDDDE